MRLLERLIAVTPSSRWALSAWALIAVLPGLAAPAATARDAGGRAWSGPIAASQRSASGAQPRVVRESPFGLSIEYPLLEKALGAGPCPSRALVRTFRELGSPAVRIGGDTQDLAGPSAAYRYFIRPSFWKALGCFARRTRAQITVGLNFGDGTLADNLATIAAAERAIPASQLTFSLGNEPDRYGVSHVLHSEPRFRVPALRPAGWSAGEYARQWASRRAMLGHIRVEGPDLAGDSWRAQIEPLLREDPPNQIDAHLYPTTACKSGPQATAESLSSRHTSVEVVSERSWLVDAARAAHVPAVISESNSASCGGKPGVSDTPVASVWAVRFVIAALLVGFEQVRFHSAGTSYDPFVFDPDGRITRRPLASALFFLRRWIPIGATITATQNTPALLAVKITHAGSTSMILSSFASHAVDLPIAIGGSRGEVMTDTLSATSTVDGSAPVAVVEHQATLALEPDSVVALRAG